MNYMHVDAHALKLLVLLVSFFLRMCPQLGIGVGICMGSVVTCLLFVIGIITVKVLLKHKEKGKDLRFFIPLFMSRSSASSQHVAMEKNMAYELHKPRLQRKELTGPN